MQIREKFLASLPSPTAPDSLKNELDASIKKLRALDGWIKNPGLIQKMVEERERAMRDSLKMKLDTSFYQQAPQRTEVKDSLLARLNIDSNSIYKQYAQKKQQADSLRNRVAVLQQMMKSAKGQSQESVNKTCSDIEQAKSPAKLKEIMEKNHIGDSILPKGIKH